MRLLTLVLQWPRDAAIVWARDEMPTDMEDPWFLHETISWHIVPLIATEEVIKQARAPGELRSQLIHALERFRRKATDRIGAEDIEAIRKEIRCIVEAQMGPAQP